MGQGQSAAAVKAVDEAPSMDVRTSLPEKYVSAVNYALNPKLSPEEVLCTVNSQPLTRKDLLTLSPGTWLNDEIVNAMLHIILERSMYEHIRAPGTCPKVMVFNTYFFSLLAPTLVYDRQKGERMMKKIAKPLFDFDIVLIPIHVGLNHWALVAINMNQHIIAYYDSLPNDGKLVLGVIEAFVEDEAKRQDSAHKNIGWVTQQSSRDFVPQQQNAFDCGMFSLMFADKIASQKMFLFSQRDMSELRRRVAATLLWWKE